MAQVPDSRLKTLSFAKGVDNRSHETKVDPGYARKADNVDIDQDGVVTVRDGYELLAPLANAHSLWSNDLLAFALVADSTTLYRMDPDGALTALVTGLDGSDVGYALIANRVYWANSTQTGIVKLSGAVLPWGVETPLPSFTLTAVANGGLNAGTYGVAITFASTEREEGGAEATVYVDVPEGGGVLVNNVPAAQQAASIEARIYMTSTNGTDLQYVASAMPGAASYLLGAGALGRPLTTQFCAPFPAVKYPLAKSGRLFGAFEDRMLIWSEPLYYGLWRPTMNFIRLQDPITMIAAPEGARFTLYIGTAKKVYVLQGEYGFRGEGLNSATLSIVSHQGAIPGSMARVPPTILGIEGVLAPVPLWAGYDGVPYAGTERGVEPMHKLFTYPLYDKAAATFVQQGGHSRYIVSGRGGRTSGLATSDVAVATVYDNGGGP